MSCALPTAAAGLIDARIQAPVGWRGHTLAHLRALIREAEPDPPPDPGALAMDPHSTLHTTRMLPFTPDAVYAAFASPERLAQWWGPEGFTNAFETFDFTEGGRWVFDMIGPEGTRHRNENVFEALAPGERVVIRHVCAPLFTLTVSLAAAPGGTHLSWTQAFDDAATAQAIRHICEPANEQNLDRLTRVLAPSGASGSR